MGKFWKWVSDKLPKPTELKTISIDEALGQSKVFSALANRVNLLEKKNEL